MKTFLTTFVCMLSLACYSQQARISFRPARTWIEAGDMWAGQFSTSGEFQIAESKFFLGFNVEGIYGVKPNSLPAVGRETVITSGGSSPYYDPENPIWDEGLWQLESSTYKQMALGVGPRITYLAINSGSHQLGFSIDILLRYNDQTYIQYMETVRTTDGRLLDVTVPVYWSYIDWASAISFEYTYSITEHFAVGAFGQFRASSEYYQYGSYGLVTTWMF